MDINQLLIDFQKDHTTILKQITEVSPTIKETYRLSRLVYDQLYNKTETTIILLREFHKITDFSKFMAIYQQSLTLLLLTVNFKVHSQLTKLALSAKHSNNNQLDLNSY